VLQELAGVVTPFTERVRAEAEAEVAATHEAELADLRAEHEARLAALRADYEQELRRQIQERLLRLAGYGPKVPRRASDVPAGEVSRDG
jgi:chromosome segregation ATPase